MQADYSGFARAAQINAQAMANLGEQIGSAVTKYAVNKQKKEDKKLRYESILPYTTSMFGAEEGEKMAQTFSNDPKLGAQILEFAGMQKDQAALQQALAVSTTPEGGIDYPSVLPAYLEFGGRDPEGVSKLVDEQTSKRYFEPKKIDLGDGITVVQTGPNTSQVVKTPSGDAKLPAGVQVRQYDAKRLEEAMQAYHQGDDAKANTILLQLGHINKITGKPLDPFDIFGERKPLPESEVPSLQDSDEGETKGDSLGLGI
jgi:hypothetical protein